MTKVWVPWLTRFDAHYIAQWWTGQGDGKRYEARPIWWTLGARWHVLQLP